MTNLCFDRERETAAGRSGFELFLTGDVVYRFQKNQYRLNWVFCSQMALHLGTDGFYWYLRLNGNFTEADISIYLRWCHHLLSRRRVIAIFGVSSACHRRVIAVFSHKYVYSYWFYNITASRMNYRCQRSAFLKKNDFLWFRTLSTNQNWSYNPEF